MKSLFRLALLAGLAALPLCALAQSPTPPPLDPAEAEVLRRGNHVEHIDGRHHDDGRYAFVEAMGPPASDADKWFISLVTMKGCGPCERLKSDWKTSPHLLSLADPSSRENSWAHFGVYPREDRSQAFRFERLQIRSYPTVIVQPPRSGKYGPAATVVFQESGYDGDALKLKTKIVAAIRQYVEKLPRRATPEEEEAPPIEQTVDYRPQENAVGLDPPWEPAPKDPLGPILPDDGQDVIIPPPAPLVPNLASGLLVKLALVVGALMLLPILLVLFVLAVLMIRRAVRRGYAALRRAAIEALREEASQG